MAALLAGFIGLFWWSTAQAEPACADAAIGFNESAMMRRPQTIETFSVGGADISFAAIGRSAYADTGMARDLLEEAEEMRKFLPGYPQPAHVTFTLSVAF